MLVTVQLLLRLQLLKVSVSSEKFLSEVSSLYLVVGIQLGYPNFFKQILVPCNKKITVRWNLISFSWVGHVLKDI